MARLEPVAAAPVSEPRRARLIAAAGLLWLLGVGAWYYIGTFVAAWTTLTR